MCSRLTLLPWTLLERRGTSPIDPSGHSVRTRGLIHCRHSNRIHQDDAISSKFLQPWSATLNSSLQAAIKSRAIVKSSRVALDACRGTLKTISLGGNAIKLEQGRLDVENAEEKLVNATEEAINLMRSVLENVRSSSFYYSCFTFLVSGLHLLML